MVLVKNNNLDHNHMLINIFTFTFKTSVLALTNLFNIHVQVITYKSALYNIENENILKLKLSKKKCRI